MDGEALDASAGEAGLKCCNGKSGTGGKRAGAASSQIRTS
jgi:hypothetical protein